MKLPLLFALTAALVYGQQPARTPAADLGKALLSAGLDANECYRIHDVELFEDTAQFYLTSGYLIFGKPVSGGPVAAVFTAEADGGDAEVLLLPPSRSERKSMSAFTGTPNLNEHFSNAVFLFTEEQARHLQEEIRGKETAKKATDIGALLADQWSPVVSNLLSSFESRIVLDLMNHDARLGFFGAIVQGRKLGNFSVTRDPRAYEQISAGQMVDREGQRGWNVWTSFSTASPKVQPEDRIISYHIEAALDSDLTLDCVTVMKVRVSEGQRAIPFDLAGAMSASEAKVDGVPAEVYQRDSVRSGLMQNSGNELVLVVPAQTLDAGAEHEIEIHHKGKVIKDAGHGVYFVESRNNWYPNRGLQFADYDATFRYPRHLDLVSAGEIKEDRTEGETRITRFVPNAPIRMLGFNLGGYERKVVESGGLTVEVVANQAIEDALRSQQQAVAMPSVAPNPATPLGARPRRSAGPLRNSDLAPPPPPALPINPANALTDMAGEIAAAMEFFSARFGNPPLKRLEVSPLPGHFGQGFPGLIYLSTLSYLPPTSGPVASLPIWQQVFYGELLRAHEAAHQWWGNLVVSSSYHNEWITEALANYSALMFLESRKGPKFTDMVLTEYRKELLAKTPDGSTVESGGPPVDGQRLDNAAHPNAWEAVAYGKGAWIFHMLRRRMGDASFGRMLAELRRRYEYKSLDTESLRLLCAEFLPPGSPDPKLENFFDEWVYGTGIPSLKLTYSVKGKPGAYRLTGQVAQTEVSDDFSVTVPVEIQTGKGKVVQQVRTGSEPAPFSIAVTGPAAKAVLDPGQTVLRR
jgi:hypothetical protein